MSWLNGLLTCDLTKTPPGSATYGLAVGRNGRIIAEVTVVEDHGPEGSEHPRLLLAIPRSVSEPFRAHLDHYVVMEGRRDRVRCGQAGVSGVDGSRPRRLATLCPPLARQAHSVGSLTSPTWAARFL